MRVRGLAFIGLVVGAFVISPSPSSLVSAATAVSSQTSTSSLDRFFSSDGPESLHEASNQGTFDEPKAWPQANAWLHAQLTEAEKEFLTLAVTGTVPASPNMNGGLTQAQLTDATGQVQTTLRFNFASTAIPANFASQLQNDLVAALTASGATLASVSMATTAATTNNGASLTLATFTFSPSASATAGAQYLALNTQFISASSALRLSTTFQNIDLSYFTMAVFVSTPVTGAPTGPAPTGAATVAPTPSATTAMPTTAASSSYCTANPTTCLNGGTCSNLAASPFFECVCQSGFIGTNCQYSLGPQSKRGFGTSVTRPKVSVAKPKFA